MKRHPRGAVAFPVSRRREKTPEKRTGQVRLASGSRARVRAGNQAREPRRRKGAPAPARRRARYARNSVPLPGGGGREGGTMQEGPGMERQAGPGT